MSVLYRITNKVNGKMYFGQTTRQPEKRKNEYFKYGQFPNDHMRNSFNKYGKENFEFEVMFECPEEMLDVCEELLIYLLDTQNRDKGYNKDSGGNLNKRHSEETKQKMSKSIKEYWGSEAGQEQKQKLSESKTGVPLSEEHKQKLSESKTGVPLSEETKQKMSKSIKEYWGSEAGQEQKQKYSESKKEYWDSEVGQEQKQKYSESKKEYWDSEAGQKQKQKMSESRTGEDHPCYRHELDNDVLRDEYVNQELSCREIARRHNTSPDTVRYRLNKLGIDTSKNRCRQDLIDDEIIDLYVNQNLSSVQIANKYNTHHSTILTRLNKHGIDTSKKNTSGYFHVLRCKCSSCKQGFRWIYYYIDNNGKQKEITSVDIEKLEAKVKARGLEWRKL